MWHRVQRRDERGSVTLLTVVVLAVLMVSSAFVIDIGLKRVAHSDMQAVADIVALDLAREIDGRTVAELEPILGLVADASLARNPDVVGNAAPLVDIELGVMTATGFTDISAGVPNAVRVTAGTGVTYVFGGFTGENETTTAAAAIADSSSSACFKLGTFVAAINAGDSTVLAPLNEMLGVNLDLVAYRGLAAADLRLSQLAAESTIGSPEALLDSQIQFGVLLRAMASALSKETGTNNTVAISALNQIAASTVTAAIGYVRLGDVLAVSPTDRAALDIALDVLDLVGAARLADGNYFVSVDNIQAGVPGVGYQFTGGIYLISAAELACGAPNTSDAVADTAQLSGSLGVTFVNMPSLNVPNLATLQTPKGVGTIVAEIGGGTGRLISPPVVHCGDNTAADPSTFSVRVDTDLAAYRVSADLSVTGDVKLSNLLDLGLGGLLTELLGNLLTLTKVTLDVELTLTAGTSRAPGGETANLSIPPNDETPVRTGDPVYLNPANVLPTINAVKLDGKTVTDLTRVKALTDLITTQLISSSNDFVQKTLVPLIDNVNNRFIGPVARMAGLRFAGADVFAAGVVCGLPRLSG